MENVLSTLFQVEATIENTKALKELNKTIDKMAMGIIGELMSLKETLVTCLVQNKPTPDYPLAPFNTKKEKTTTNENTN